MLKKICNFFSIICLIALGLIAAALILPKILGYDQYAVLSGSMEPEIHVGAVVYAKAEEAYTPEIGDIITYRFTGGTLVTHRVVAVNEEEQTVTTKGDANDSEDQTPVPYGNIVGVYAFDLPYLGYISIYGKTPLGIAVICGVIVVMILLNFLPDVFSEEKKKKETTGV